MSGLAAEQDPGAALAVAHRLVRRALSVHIDDLAHLPDWVTPDARGAVIAEAKGGRQKLHMLLATALFLAEREHRPRVDLALLQRAASLQGAPEPTAPQAARRAPRLLIPAIAGLSLVAVLATVFLMPPPSAKAPVIAPPVRAAIVVPTIVVTIDEAFLQPVAPVVQVPAMLTPPAPAVSVVATANALPAAPPVPTLRLSFPSDSPDAATQARAARSALQAAGFLVNFSPDRSDSPPTAAVLRYYYAADKAAADRVAQTTGLQFTTPELVPVADRRSPPAPGTIELYLP
ncbi:MAG TPA: hypothetical protein VMB71_15955 [Acetobacteraceae bacterium]|nr:hypothetical protein [Acetobacteraceae bacterium]